MTRYAIAFVLAAVTTYVCLALLVPAGGQSQPPATPPAAPPPGLRGPTGLSEAL